MTDNHYYHSLTQAMHDLERRGYTHVFEYQHDNCLHCPDNEEVYKPDELAIDEVYRFEGESNPDDNAVLYAIHSESGLRGQLMDANGAYSDTDKSRFLSGIRRN